MSDSLTELPPGLISFAYNAIHNPQTNLGVLFDPDKEMSKFGLSEEIKAVILKAQSGEENDQEYKRKFVVLLAQELAAALQTLASEGA
jgi:hypothetical protein